MLRPKRVKNGTTGAGRIFSVVVVAWLIFGWSRPAFPDEQRHLQLAPIQFRSSVDGDIGYTYMSNTYGAKTSNQQSLGVGVVYHVRAQSYLWQPWLARVTGGLGLGVSANTSSYNTAPTTKSGNELITGDAALDLVKQSRFPFQARVYRSVNQTNGFSSGINSNYISNGLSLTQNYRTRNGKLNSQASYSHTTSGRASFGTEDASNQLNFTLTTEPAQSQTFRVAGAMTNTDHPLIGISSLADTLLINHLYSPNSALSVGSFVDLIKTSYTITPLTPGISPQQSDYNSQQLSSFASWRPEGSPITLTSSARLLSSNSSSNGVTAPHFGDTNLNLGANYAWSKLLRMYGSVHVDDNSGIQTVSANAALAALKGIGERDIIMLGGFRYTRFVGASLSNQTTTTTDSASNQTTTSSVQSLGGNLSHALDNHTELGGGQLATNLNQALSTILSTLGSPFTHLSSSGSLSWNHMEDRGTTMLRLNAADSRDLSGTQKFFQLINLQTSRTERVARNQSLAGNLTMQVSRSGASGVPTTPFSGNPSAALSYSHHRLLNVKDLTFDSTLSIVGADILSSQNQASASWENNLNYFIGRLKLRLTTQLAEVNKVRQSSLLFTMNRAF